MSDKKLYNENVLDSLFKLVSNIDTNEKRTSVDGQELTNSKVICVDGSWGTGKTVFCKSLIKKTEGTSLKSIYFNSFESDYDSDPLISLITCFAKSLPRSKFENFINETSEALKPWAGSIKSFVKGGAGLVVSGLTNGASDMPLMKQFKDASLTAGEEWISNAIKSLSNKDDSINSLHHIIHKYFNSFEAVLIVIDELDRCRPTYAVEVIEKIKHVFNIQNVHFVLSMDKEQLLDTVSNSYGLKSEKSKFYLDKFIDFEFKIQSNCFNVREKVDLDSVSLNIYEGLHEEINRIGDVKSYFSFDLKEDIPLFIGCLVNRVSTKFPSFNLRASSNIVNYIATCFMVYKDELQDDLDLLVVSVYSLIKHCSRYKYESNILVNKGQTLARLGANKYSGNPSGVVSNFKITDIDRSAEVEYLYALILLEYADFNGNTVDKAAFDLCKEALINKYKSVCGEDFSRYKEEVKSELVHRQESWEEKLRYIG
ncbi:KAP family P-loop NTPase fold protein [Larsenimonas suaedae]|uniref:P-loop NTPase fold protein n=1 Tax=Larsenimonas suaedae TaxID=1851019 RepID=A0ABU1GTI0_9GAMM|nr:P-loop NTPase fold protein [Larsenimonas suaedae]MCM2971781.1 KAP family NTPase [Larsenimonas suaedae]MDR5895334.1 P-loop NTPase fold protein [Larsenimonas suaedae]